MARGARYSAVFVQKELAPRFPPLFELLLSALHAKVIYDIDDAIFLPYAESKNPLVRLILGRKIPSALRRSEVVLAGNSFLKDYASRFNRGTILFPIVVDAAKYRAARSSYRKDFEPWRNWVSRWCSRKPKNLQNISRSRKRHCI